MIKTKKSQLGNIIASIVVTFFVIFIMAIYLTLAGGIVLLKKPSPPDPFATHSSNLDLLSQKIKISLNGEEKEILVLDALYLKLSGKITEETLKKSLSSLDQETGNCHYLSAPLGQYVIFTSSSRDPLYDSAFASKIKSAKTLKAKINGNDLEIRSYFGECS